MSDMKRVEHALGSASHRSARADFEKIIHNLCPRCGCTDLAVYFRSGSRQKVGAFCYSCGLVGFFARDDFFQLGKMPNVHRTIPRGTLRIVSG